MSSPADQDLRGKSKRVHTLNSTAWRGLPTDIRYAIAEFVPLSELIRTQKILKWANPFTALGIFSSTRMKFGNNYSQQELVKALKTGDQLTSVFLLRNTTIKVLNLYGNNIGAQGAEAIADALKLNTTVNAKQ